MHNDPNHGWASNYYCFFAAFACKMIPNSGKHKIKFKMDNIDNNYVENIIGIISETSKNNINVSEKIKNDNSKNNKDWYWCDRFYDYIGWSFLSERNTDDWTEIFLQNGLLCGYSNWSSENNIFRKNKFIYQSNNDNYKQRLPGIYTNDIIILEYDSDLSTLSFAKENDGGKLNVYISNLPTDKTFYWFVGHDRGAVCLTVQN